MGLFFLTAVCPRKWTSGCIPERGSDTSLKGKQMARKPNYGFEKRQKEIAKKAKKDEKKKNKLEEGALEPPEESEEESGEESPLESPDQV